MSGGRTTNTPQKKRPPRRPDKREPKQKPDRTLYRKVVLPSGRVRYVSIGEQWDFNGLPYGEWLISCSPGRTAIHRLDDPEDDQVRIQRAALVAAARIAEDAMVLAMMERSRLEPASDRLTPREQRAWAAYRLALGSDEPLMLRRPSVHDIVYAGIEALIDSVTGLDETNGP